MNCFTRLGCFTAISIVVLIASTCAFPQGAVPSSMKCTDYTGADTKRATCNEMSGVICEGGCSGNFVVAENCVPSQFQGEAPSTQTCTRAFGRNTAAAKTCINENGSFSCRGKTSGQPTCSECRR